MSQSPEIDYSWMEILSSEYISGLAPGSSQSWREDRSTGEVGMHG